MTPVLDALLEMVVSAVAPLAITVDIQTVLYAVFGAGGIGFVTVLVTSYRRIKSGKIVDDDSIIQRQLKELKRKDSEIESLQADVNGERVAKNRAQEDAARYRLQLIREGLKPLTREESDRLERES